MPNNKNTHRLSSALLLIFATGGCALLGCRDPGVTQVPPGHYDLLPGNVDLSNATNSKAPAVLKYSVVNGGSSIAPARSYDVEFYVDDKLLSFDRATSAILPGRSTDYSFTSQLAKGHHKYRLAVDPSNRLPEANETNNDVVGGFEVR